MLTTDDQQRLLQLARLALEARVRRDAPPLRPGEDSFTVRCGAFVSIHRGAALRGCLGRLDCDMTLAEVIVPLATVVADSDPRFEPVQPSELDQLAIEISVLTPERGIDSIADIHIGRHGL